MCRTGEGLITAQTATVTSPMAPVTSRTAPVTSRTAPVTSRAQNYKYSQVRPFLCSIPHPQASHGDD